MELQIDHSGALPMHIQVEQLLRKLIETSPYKDGAYLPREVELANLLGISRNTLRQATNKLEYEGLITRKKGQGTKVAHKTLTTKLDNWLSFTQEMNDNGIEFVNYMIKAEWVESSEVISGFFKIPEKTKVVCLTRLRGDAEGPFVYFESYFHPRIGITPADDFSIPLYRLLETRFNIVVKTSREKIRARNASSITAKRLQIAKNDAVLIRERFVCDPGNRPIEYNMGFYVAEKFTYSINIER